MGWCAPGVAAVNVDGLWDWLLIREYIGDEGMEGILPEDLVWV